MENSYIDLIIRIKNGYLARKEEVSSPHSNFREKVARVLKEINFIADYQVTGDKKKQLTISLSYEQNQPALTDIKIMSKPGQRFYISYKNLKPVLGGLGYSIISTAQGVMTNKQAHKKKLGGELLFKIW